MAIEKFEVGESYVVNSNDQADYAYCDITKGDVITVSSIDNYGNVLTKCVKCSMERVEWCIAIVGKAEHLFDYPTEDTVTPLEPDLLEVTPKHATDWLIRNRTAYELAQEVLRLRKEMVELQNNLLEKEKA